jgi:hypothetical protein
LKAHPQLKKAKKAWVAFTKAHMATFYVNNKSELWKVDSDMIGSIPQWESIPAGVKEEYLRQDVLVTAKEES